MLVFLHRFLVAQDGDGVIAVQLELGFSDPVLQESPAVVVLIENFDVAGDELECLHAIDLLLLLQAFGDGPVFGQLVDVVQDLLLLLLHQVLKHIFDLLAVEHGVVLLRVVQDSHEPVEVIVVEVLNGDVFGHPGHSQGVLVLEFFAVFGGLVAVEEAVELDGSADGLVEAQIVVAFFF
jgi:hypothetical protein